MIKNYVTIALRNISKNRVYAAINILGLSIGITCSLLLLLYIQAELSFDKFHTNSKNIYRIASIASIQDTQLDAPITMAPLGPTLFTDYSEVQNFVRILDLGKTLITDGEVKFFQNQVFTTDSSFFEVFSFELLHGNASNCLSEPNSIVLTESLSKKFFGDENPLGKALKTETPDGEILRSITGVMADPPVNSHIRPTALVSYGALTSDKTEFWANLDTYTYIQLREGVNPDHFSKYFPLVFDKYISPVFSQFNAEIEFYLQPLEEIYLYSNLDHELAPPGNISYIYTFISIAIFILIVACINYMNLATARSANRSKEVGIRKAMGSHRSQIVWQFLSESMVVTLLAVILSGITVFFIIPEFNSLSGKNIDQNFISDPAIMLMMLAVTLFVGILGGSYPSLYLSKFKAAEVLGSKMRSKGGSGLRKSLVVVQFSISMVMIISTWVVFDQLNYLRTKDLGFNKDQVVKILLNGEEIRTKFTVLKNALLKSPQIESVASSWATPGGDNFNMSAIKVENSSGEMIDQVFRTMIIDSEFIPTLEIEMLEGRNFIRGAGTDTSSAVIVNEEMVRHMGWETALGKKFNIIVNQNLDMRLASVVGVVKDFHLRALQEPIEPVVIHNANENGNMLVRMKQGGVKKTLAFIDETWDQIIQNKPIQYNFLSQDFDRQYEADQKRGEVFAIFSALTIMISCLGLFGLSSYTAEAKSKEIGIRKVVGASIPGIMYMISKGFLKLVGLAILISFPIAYYFMSEWLSSFAFHSDIKMVTFMISALVTVAITLATITYHSLSAAGSNPTQALREQ